MFYRANMSTLTVNKDAGAQYPGLGGHALSSCIVRTEVGPCTHPLDQENKLVVAAGLLSGTTAPNASRMSLAAKSPLTAAVRVSNVGGTMAMKLGRLDIRGIIIEGRPLRDSTYVLQVSARGAAVQEIPELKGLDIFDTVAKLQEIFGLETAIGCIGTAGEHKMVSACIGFTDVDGVPARQAGRGGLGAVMGSKNIKAIVVDDSDAETVAVADADAYRAGEQKLLDALLTYSAKAVSDDRIGNHDGRVNHVCSSQCRISSLPFCKCQNGGGVSGAPKHASHRSLGMNLGIDNLADVAAMNRLCDDYGVDTVEMGAALGLMMKAGIIPFGDGQAAIRLLHEVGNSTLLGRILGAGADITAKIFGVSGILNANGRVQQHQTKLPRKPQILAAFLDDVGLCRFAVAAILDAPVALEGIIEMCNARYGWQKTFEEYTADYTDIRSL